MLQRSPTYVVSRPDEDAIANTLRKVLPDKAGLRRHPPQEHDPAAGASTSGSRTQPEKVKA